MKPILFNTEMVRAILEGKKTVTRRVIKPQPLFTTHRKYIFADETCPKKWADCDDFVGKCAPYQVGDVLYVRETFCWCPCWDCGFNAEGKCLDDTAHKFYHTKYEEHGCYGYKASFEEGELPFGKWHPSIHMPKEAARIFLRVTDVRVERLHDMTELDARDEGFKDIYLFEEDMRPLYTALVDFSRLWNSTIPKKNIKQYGWDANPWVWVIEFEMCGADMRGDTT